MLTGVTTFQGNRIPVALCVVGLYLCLVSLFYALNLSDAKFRNISGSHQDYLQLHETTLKYMRRY